MCRKGLPVASCVIEFTGGRYAWCAAVHCAYFCRLSLLRAPTFAGSVVRFDKRLIVRWMRSLSLWPRTPSSLRPRRRAQRQYTASLGGGAQCNGHALRASDTTDIRRSLLVTGFGYDHGLDWEANLELFRHFTDVTQVLTRLF